MLFRSHKMKKIEKRKLARKRKKKRGGKRKRNKKTFAYFMEMGTGKTVDATKAHKVAEGMKTLLQNTNLEKIGKYGSDFSREKFVWEKREEKLLRIIDKLT